FSALADFLRRTRRHADLMARLSQTAFFSRLGRIRQAPPPLRRSLTRIFGQNYQNLKNWNKTVVACFASDSSCEIGTEANEGNEGDVFLDSSAQIHRCVGRVWRNTLEF